MFGGGAGIENSRISSYLNLKKLCLMVDMVTRKILNFNPGTQVVVEMKEWFNIDFFFRNFKFIYFFETQEKLNKTLLIILCIISCKDFIEMALFPKNSKLTLIKFAYMVWCILYKRFYIISEISYDDFSPKY